MLIQTAFSPIAQPLHNITSQKFPFNEIESPNFMGVPISQTISSGHDVTTFTKSHTNQAWAGGRAGRTANCSPMAFRIAVKLLTAGLPAGDKVR